LKINENKVRERNKEFKDEKWNNWKLENKEFLESKCTKEL
jgi:hypothetical protein